jgi:hypothetical protein
MDPPLAAFLCDDQMRPSAPANKSPSRRYVIRNLDSCDREEDCDVIRTGVIYYLLPSRADFSRRARVSRLKESLELYMNPQTSPDPGGRRWRQLYRAAILEAGDSILPQRVAEAEQAIVARARELFVATGDHFDEQEALDDALYALRALQTSWRSRTGYTSSRYAGDLENSFRAQAA